MVTAKLYQLDDRCHQEWTPIALASLSENMLPMLPGPSFRPWFPRQCKAMPTAETGHPWLPAKVAPLVNGKQKSAVALASYRKISQ